MLTSSIDIILFVAGLVVWAMVLLLALDNLGVQIKPLLAGLGIGGIAIALAVQTVLGDLLASLSIALDKPFTIGDSLSVDDFQGTVEHIGVKSTRLRSISGEQIIISNTDILKSAGAQLRPHARAARACSSSASATRRRPMRLRRFPPPVAQIVEAQPEVRFDRCHFLTYGDTALQFEMVYIVTTRGLHSYADIQQRINLAILGKLRSMSVQFAAPSRNVFYIENPAPLSQSSAGRQVRRSAPHSDADELRHARETLLAQILSDARIDLLAHHRVVEQRRADADGGCAGDDELQGIRCGGDSALPDDRHAMRARHFVRPGAPSAARSA